MPTEPNPQRNPEPEPPSDGGTSYSPDTTPKGFTYVDPKDRDPVSAGIATVSEAINPGSWLDQIRYYINLYAVFWLATTILIIGILLIWGKPLFQILAGGKAKAAVSAIDAIKGD